jgi:glycerol-3-phosphate responsive antiterminator|tara:strand:- start:2269 stop:2526 length:258 start_codon:yes stop_codon:yes gene_type:complete
MAASEAKVIELEIKINEIMKKLERIEEGTSRMSKHIEFIEGVYGTVSAPMYWICNKVNRLRSIEIKDAPVLENEKRKKINILEQD